MDQQTTDSFLGTDEQPAYTPTGDERTTAVLAHVLTVVSSFLAPFIIYLIKKDESPFIAAHAKESLNFQITVFIVCLILIISLIGILFLWLVGIISLILVIVAAVRASDGKLYRYPFCLRLIK